MKNSKEQDILSYEPDETVPVTNEKFMWQDKNPGIFYISLVGNKFVIS